MLLSTYVSLTLLLDVAQTRTFWLASRTKPEFIYTGIFTASMTLKVLILLLEAQQKTKWVRWDTKEAHSPEETSGIFSLGVYFWLNGIFLSGYRKILQMKDLYPLDRAIVGADLYERFQKHADYSRMRGDKYGLAKVLARTLLVQILLPIPPRLALTGFMFCQPFLINSVLSQLSGPITPASANMGYGFIGASALIYGGIAVSTALRSWRFECFCDSHEC